MLVSGCRAAYGYSSLAVCPVVFRGGKRLSHAVWRAGTSSNWIISRGSYWAPNICQAQNRQNSLSSWSFHSRGRDEFMGKNIWKMLHVIHNWNQGGGHRVWKLQFYICGWGRCFIEGRSPRGRWRAWGNQGEEVGSRVLPPPQLHTASYSRG